MIKKCWNEKRYYSLDCYLKETFGEKVYRIALNGGMTCPNRDGTLGTKGCIFCSEGGSGDFASPSHLPIFDQIEYGKQKLVKKFPCKHFIAYFQAYTNTYAPLPYLKKIFTEAIEHPDIVVLSIATRPDCLNEEILELLTDLNRIKPVWIELGLQTIHPKTANFIRRGYDYDCFLQAVHRLQERNIPIITHLILGLPGENRSMILESVKTISSLPVEGIKLQLLHILQNTDLADYYEKTKFSIFTLEEYTELIVDCLEWIPQNIVIHRLTGDGPSNLLIAPLWSTRKRSVLNLIHR
ncbi:MAG: TIGR01212 family radical SAM protein, partial [Lachnospiraceae bacterium]|nr:TIGR01212 family radical SAM protein [Lachnospiraceae bacterium]